MARTTHSRRSVNAKLADQIAAYFIKRDGLKMPSEDSLNDLCDGWTEGDLSYFRLGLLIGMVKSRIDKFCAHGAK